ncbi:hypothetical protein CCYA_CCYA16G4128 [Cyanidiococcus yangmingshanensis]|nr:hypothetical protein CCYA_CCYA16G4128 [Cyanidiococcus yangmingshanensis]
MAFVYTFACKTWKAVSFETRHVSCGCQSLRKRQRAGSWLARKTVKDVSRTRTTLALRAGSEVPQERPLQKSLLKGASVLVALLAAFSPLLGDPTEALAAQGGGRVGGSSFRAPVTRSAPSRSYSGPSGGVGGYYYSPAPILPVTPFFFGPVVVPFGFTGFGTFLFAAAFLAFATRALGSARDGVTSAITGDDDSLVSEKTTLVKLKVGLLSTARELQQELEEIALHSKTDTIAGLQQVLQETTLALYRNPDYWSHGSIETTVASFSEAEAVFNRESFAERGKLERETLSNVAGRVDVRRRNNSELDPTDMRISEYIVVTLIVAASGRIPSLPKQIRNSGDVEATLRALSSIPRESLQGVEVIWSPQSLEDVLTEREMLTDHPELVRI